MAKKVDDSFLLVLTTVVKIDNHLKQFMNHLVYLLLLLILDEQKSIFNIHSIRIGSPVSM